MKKLITTTLVTCSLISVTSLQAHAQENNSIKPESLKKPINTKVHNDQDVKAYLEIMHQRLSRNLKNLEMLMFKIMHLSNMKLQINNKTLLESLIIP
ncbi:hypothetical protein QI233_07575 [Staphylococcus saprophyticus]|nr:hypothetical protein [Staphylococcus saprophyticus]MDW4111243.1 hypothetical protein [Staphylococcus saprophyticus]MDW4136746.1 hypothetical protein [Staphylococcus saprophyticus]